MTVGRTGPSQEGQHRVIRVIFDYSCQSYNTFRINAIHDGLLIRELME